MIGKMLESITWDESNSVSEIPEKLRRIAGFFQETRGQQSRAIFNAIRMMMPPLIEMRGLPLNPLRKLMAAKIQAYTAKAQQDLQEIVRISTQLVEPMDAILVFDYSSTINTFLERLRPAKKVFIPESRSLDGGHPFVPACLRAGHEVHFIPDAAILNVLRTCDAAFIGAETFYPDGTVFNTIGSDIVAVLCDYLRVPFYVLTPMIKVDTRSVEGYTRSSPMPFNFVNRMAADWLEEEKEKVDFSGIKLLKVPPNLITAYVTERGILPTSALFNEAMGFDRVLRGEMLNV